MKKTQLILSIALLWVQIIFSQTANLKEANRNFYEKEFFKAIELYEAMPEKSAEVLQRLADSYYYTGNHPKAVENYRLLFNKTDNPDKDIYLRYADALKAVGDYDKADQLLSTYAGNQINTLGGIEMIDLQVPQVYDPILIDGLSASSDFGPAYYDRQIVFASSRNPMRPVFSWTNEPFLDLYYAKVDGTTITDEGLFPGNINTDRHESNASFSTDGKFMYFTRNRSGFARVGDEKVSTLQIIKAELQGGKWININPVSFSSKTYSVAHPSLSSDGKTLYFSSDMPGGFGSYDIYSVTVNEDGSYGIPVNLGPNVNTSQREQFPFVSDRGNLYFSSNYYEGLGGMDLYRSDLTDNGFAKAYNLGSSINSSRDDFSLIIKENEGSGFFSSNRTGQDKIWRFNSYPGDGYLLRGTVKDKRTGKLLSGVEISLLEKGKSEPVKKLTGEDGQYKFEVNPSTIYIIRGAKDLYIPVEIEIAVQLSQDTEMDLDLDLQAYADVVDNVVYNERNLKTQIEMENIYFDFNQHTIRPEAAVTLDKLVAVMNEYPEMKVEVASHTDSRGSADYNMALSEKRAASTVDYLTSQGISPSRLTAKGYGETDPVNPCGNDCTDVEHNQNRRSEFTILK